VTVGPEVTELIERFVREGLACAAHPGIVFKPGPSGRRAALAGDGLVPLQVMPSPLRGASGNVEFLGRFRVGGDGPSLLPGQLAAAVEEAHR